MTFSHGRYATRATTGAYADMAPAIGGHAERVRNPAGLGAYDRASLRARLDGQAALLKIISAETQTSSSRPQQAQQPAQ
jgi:hypothetical protein